MSGGGFVLSDEDRAAIHAPHSVPINPAWSGCPICVDFIAAVEAITQRAITAALNDAAVLLKQMAAERMDVAGPNDKRANATWDVSWWLTEDFPAIVRARANPTTSPTDA